MLAEKAESMDILRGELKELERVFDSIADLIFIQDKNSTVIRVNAACAKFLNSNPEDLVGKKCYEIMHKMDRPWPGCPFEKAKADRNSHDEEVNDPNIGLVLLVTVSPILDGKGEFIGAVHIAKDITAIKKTEEELKKKIESLEHFQRVSVDRELRMKELKAKIAELEARLAKK